jgi:alkylation response protein AidB-like acyl-CoA dehydrogenase
VEMELMALEITNLRVLSGFAKNQGTLGPEVSMLKIKGSEIIQTLAELKMHALGHDALPYVREALDMNWAGNPQLNTHYRSYAPPLSGQYFNQRKTTIYAGSTEVQKNIISQMILGL